ncbi:Copper chaperone for superoxide dismutase [Nymphaea thermarum]|nr:Copper chaperone for superoxide dismutase [Nymphaea thermarum]
MELDRIEASFSSLSPGKHRWSINEFGDLTNGSASTGKVFNPLGGISEECRVSILCGTHHATLTSHSIWCFQNNTSFMYLGTLNVNEADAFSSGAKKMMKVMDLFGRSIVVYETEDRFSAGIAAAAIARSASVGENYKRICTCDGTVIWESGDSNFSSS